MDESLLGVVCVIVIVLWFVSWFFGWFGFCFLEIGWRRGGGLVPSGMGLEGVGGGMLVVVVVVVVGMRNGVFPRI